MLGHWGPREVQNATWHSLDAARYLLEILIVQPGGRRRFPQNLFCSEAYISATVLLALRHARAAAECRMSVFT